MRTGTALAVMTLVALPAAGESAEPRAKGETLAASDPLVLAVEQHTGEDENYAQRIEEYRTAQAEGTSLTDEQKRRYSNAYVYSGRLLYQQADAEGAADAFRQAATIDETNPLALYCLGLLYRKHNNPKSAVENLYAAAKLGEPLRDACAAQLKEIVASVIERAGAATKNGNPTEAALCYLFLINNFPGKTKAKALEQLEVVEDAADPIAVAVERYASEEQDYARLIEEYRAAQAEGNALTAAQQRRTSNAYVYCGYALYWHQNAKGAKVYFDQAIVVDEKNALAHFCLGVLERKGGHLKPAAASLHTARDLGGPLEPWCRKHLNEIALSLFDEADALIERGHCAEAAKRYKFLAENFDGVTKTNALDLLKENKDEVKAEHLLNQAQRLIAEGRHAEGHKWLEHCRTTYSWTRAAETAKKILRNGRIDVKVTSQATAGKIAARERWIDLETTNFIIYYRENRHAKIVAQHIEETFQRVARQFQYTSLDWSKKKCKIFVFDNVTAWDKFEKDLGEKERGASFADIEEREIYMAGCYLDYMLNRLLPFHLTMIIHRESVDKGTYLPGWLITGLACHHDFTDKKEYYYNVAAEALKSGAFVPLQGLTGLEESQKVESSLYFAETELLIEFILERFGNDGLARLHKELRKEYEFDALVKRALNMELEDFEKEWLAYVKKKVTSAN